MEGRNTYSDEYRRETADYVISTGRPVMQIAEELGLNQKTLNTWVHKRRAELNGKTAEADQSDELKVAQKRIRELEMENSFLKKAAAFFAKEQE